MKRVTGKELSGLAANGIIHLINSGATTLDGSGQSLDAAGNPVMKEPWNLTDADVENCLKATTWYPADRDYFRGGGFSSNFLSKGGMPVTMMRLNLKSIRNSICVQTRHGLPPGLCPVCVINRLSKTYIQS